MVNKKGWLRILEAGIAILLIFGVVLIIATQRGTKVSSQDFTQETKSILEEIAKNNSLRSQVLKYDLTQSETSSSNAQILSNLRTFIGSRIRQTYLEFEIKICDPSKNCYLDPYPDTENIYTSDRIISTNPDESLFKPKRIKIFIWTKK